MAGSDDVTSPVFDSPSTGAAGAAAAKGAKDALTAKQRNRRRLKIAALILLLLLVAFLLYRLLSGDESIPGITKQLPHYETSIYGAVQPMGVAVSPDGERVYVTESGGRRLVRVYDRSGEQVDALKPPGHVGKWRLPVYVAVGPAPSEDVYVSDRLRQTVYVYGREGKFDGTFEPKGRLGKGANPLGLAFGPDGDLYMTDVGGGRRKHRVLVFGDDEEPLRRIGSPGDFWFPNGIVVNDDGEVFVADSNDGRLAIFDAEGKPASAIQRGVGDGDLGLPRGVALDDGKLYVVDTTAHAVKVYEVGGETDVPSYVGSFGVEGFADGTFQYPNGIAIDGDGKIYVTDRENNRVQVWTY
jgi:DNA-binding beta-propeller fold protein YncE